MSVFERWNKTVTGEKGLPPLLLLLLCPFILRSQCLSHSLSYLLDQIDVWFHLKFMISIHLRSKDYGTLKYLFVPEKKHGILVSTTANALNIYFIIITYFYLREDEGSHTERDHVNWNLITVYVFVE